MDTDDKAALELIKLASSFAITPPPGFRQDLSGAVYRTSFLVDPGSELPSDSIGTGVPTGRPSIDEEIFEWLDLATAVNKSSRPLIFLELGAGFGRWSARFFRLAHAAQKKIEKVVLVEAEPTHAEWSRQNMIDNGVPPSEFEVIEAAVSAGEWGDNLFYVGKPTAEDGGNRWFGQSLVSSAHSYGQPVVRNFLTFLRRTKKTMEGWDAIKVRTLRLGKILDELPYASLIDFDVQNAEGGIILDSAEKLTEKVGMLHIGTHSREAEVAIRDTLKQFGWESVRDFGCNQRIDTLHFGEVDFQDGVQTWVNPTVVC